MQPLRPCPSPLGAAEAIPGQRFASPFAVRTPPGAEGWQSMYPYYALLSEERREVEDGRFWFFDGMHNPEPMFPFDTIATENWWVAVSQMSTRVWPIPLAGGIDQRIINGYLYISPSAVTDPDVIAERARHFSERAGHYFANWDDIYASWEAKAVDCITRLSAIEFEPLPDLEPLAAVTEGRGLYSTYDLLTRYSDLINNFFEIGSYHFEMLNLGYGAYLTFREFCQAAFPGISDQVIASMVSGVDIMLFRPDDELRVLANLAVELKVDQVLLKNADPETALRLMAGSPGGDEWLQRFEKAKDPWFWFSTGAGYQHTDRAWLHDLRLPFQAIRGYVESLLAGEDIRRPLEAITAERTRVTAEYRSYLAGESDRESFDGLVELARQVFPFVENHNFYVEHWHHSMFWDKVRSLGRVFVAHDFFDDEEDIFYLHRNEVHTALYDLNIGWATAIEPRGVTYWRPEIARRRAARDVLRQHPPLPALGVPPGVHHRAADGHAVGDHRGGGARLAGRSTARTRTSFVGSEPPRARPQGLLASSSNRNSCTRSRTATSSCAGSLPRAGRRCSPGSPPPSPTWAGSWPTPRSSAASTACRPWSAPASRPPPSRPVS